MKISTTIGGDPHHAHWTKVGGFDISSTPISARARRDIGNAQVANFPFDFFKSKLISALQPLTRDGTR